MAISVDEPTVIDNILYYGLFLGAIFQLICIMSVVLVPKSAEEKEIDEADIAVEPTAVIRPPQHSSSGRPKKQSKKHR